MKTKVAIVCYSLNSDLVQYFGCYENALIKDFELYKIINKRINTNLNTKTFVGSTTQKAFGDIRILFDIILSIKVLAKIIFNNIEIVHFTTAHISNLFLAIFLNLFKIKLIFTIHDMQPHPGRKSFFVKIYNYIAFELAYKIIVHSKPEILIKERLKNKIEIIKLGGFKQNITVQKTGKYILFFGRIDKYKGLEYMLEIAQKSNKKLLPFSYLIAGKGTNDYMLELSKLSNVKIVNRYIDDNELSDLFYNASFTILPYSSATQSGVNILSYSYATPVIAFNVGGIGEYVQNDYTGKLFEKGDTDGILEFLEYITEYQIMEMSHNCINYYKDFLSMEAYINNIRNFYYYNFISK